MTLKGQSLGNCFLCPHILADLVVDKMSEQTLCCFSLILLYVKTDWISCGHSSALYLLEPHWNLLVFALGVSALNDKLIFLQ